MFCVCILLNCHFSIQVYTREMIQISQIRSRNRIQIRNTGGGVNKIFLKWLKAHFL